MLMRARASLHGFRQIGPLMTLWFLVDTLLGYLTRARILALIVHEADALAALDPMLPAGFTADVRTPDAMGNLSAACAAELRQDFLDEASNTGDRCIAILEDDRVVSFQWLSAGLTRAYEDIWIGFGPRYLNGYNSFTAPSHRGKHLNRSGVVLAAQMLAVPNGKGLAGFIRASNRKSLLAHARVSPNFPGIVLVWPYGRQGLHVYVSPAGRYTGVKLVRRPAPGASTVAAARVPPSIPKSAGSLQR
jgi:hypothetical protein